jgi:hypothetical protein
LTPERTLRETVRVRRSLVTTAAVAVAVLSPAATASAPAAAGPRLSAAPNPVRLGETLTVRGRGWPVIEFCSRRVRLSLRSDQNAFRIGSVRVRASGRFTFRWVPRRGEVGPGRWRLVARMRCESGDDGSPVPVRRSVALRIRR